MRPTIVLIGFIFTQADINANEQRRAEDREGIPGPEGKACFCTIPADRKECTIARILTRVACGGSNCILT
jgi:hypothetical protein